jgi:hypothetical protein
VEETPKAPKVEGSEAPDEVIVSEDAEEVEALAEKIKEIEPEVSE